MVRSLNSIGYTAKDLGNGDSQSPHAVPPSQANMFKLSVPRVDRGGVRELEREPPPLSDIYKSIAKRSPTY